MATTPGPAASGGPRIVALYGEGYTMFDVCKGCQQRHRCASCLDGTDSEYLPPSALPKETRRHGVEVDLFGAPEGDGLPDGGRDW